MNNKKTLKLKDLREDWKRNWLLRTCLCRSIYCSKFHDMGLLMSAEIKEKEKKRKWGMEMSDSLKTTLTIRILLCYVVFDTVADFL